MKHHLPPLKVVENRVWRFYRGGAQLEQLRGRTPVDGERPEEWVGSTTEAAGSSAGTGLSDVELPDGTRRTLRDVIDADPVGHLGSRYVDTYGTSPGLLVKLLDPSERLPVHAHPSRAFARERLGSFFGKTEAWIVLGVRDDVTDPHVYLGLVEDVPPERYRRWVQNQDTDRLLGSMHRIPALPGDVVFVPGGVPHAIGGGLLVAEVQEASDLSFVCEHRGYSIDAADAYLGLSLDEGASSLDLRPRSADEIDTYRIRPDGEAVLHGVTEPYFAADRLRGGSERRSDAYELALVVDGEGVLETEWGRVPVRPGDGFALPAALPSWRLEGPVDVLVFRGPAL